jgi:hypothetical protein
MARLVSDPTVNVYIEAGIFNLSIESIIRIHLNKDYNERVEISKEKLAEALIYFSRDDINIDLKNFVICVLADALAGNDQSHKLILKQQAPGRSAPQTSDMAADFVRCFDIDRTVREARRAGQRSPNKVAALQHGCSLAEVKRARKFIAEIGAKAGKTLT